jgi:hypothetical protein
MNHENFPSKCISEDEAVQKITEIRDTIKESLPNNTDLGAYGKKVWGTLDRSTLDNVDFHGNPEKNSRILYHRLFSRLISAKVCKVQRNIMFLSIAIAFLGSVLSSMEVLLVTKFTNFWIDTERSSIATLESEAQSKLTPLNQRKEVLDQEIRPLVDQELPIPKSTEEEYNRINREIPKISKEYQERIEKKQANLIDLENQLNDIPIRSGLQLLILGSLSAIVIAILCRRVYFPAITEIIITNGDKERIEAKEIVKRVYLRDLKGINVPIDLGTDHYQDLQDVWRHGWLTSQGRPVSSEISVGDFSSDDLRKRADGWTVPNILLSLSVYNFGGAFFAFIFLVIVVLFLTKTNKDKSNLKFKNLEILFNKKSLNNTNNRYIALSLLVVAAIILTGFSFILLFSLVAIAPIIFFALIKFNSYKNPLLVRAFELQLQVPVDASTFIMAGGYPWAKISEEARIRQYRDAVNDISPIFNLGVAEGFLAARNDLYAPSGGMDLNLSFKDLTRHLLVLGGIGSGKTAGVLRPLAKKACEYENIGLVVLDGKGSLPGELANLPNMVVIDPRISKVSLVKGLSPSNLADTISDVVGANTNKGDQFFTDSARDLLRKAAILAQAAGNDYWTLDSISRIALDSYSTPYNAEEDEDSGRETQLAHVSDYLREVLDALGSIYGDTPDPVVDDAVGFFLFDWVQTEEKVKSNILATLRSWLNTLTSHPDLVKWSRTKDDEEDADITLPLSGGKLGILIPDYSYGRGGAVVTALLKARLYERIKQRAEGGNNNNEKPVLFIIDEAQEVATKDDATILAIGRSLNVAVVAATQTIEGVTEKLSEVTAKKWFGIFGSLVALRGRSRQTDEFIANFVGETWRPIIDTAQGISTTQNIEALSVIGVKAAALNQDSLRKINPKKIAVKNQKEFGLSALSSKIAITRLLEAGELSDLLAVPGTALAAVTRAGVTRRDIIRLQFDFPVSDNSDSAN